MNAERPTSWLKVRLDEVADVIQGQSPPGETYNESGEGLPFFQGKAEFGDIYPLPRKWCTAPTKVANAEDVLISIRAPVGPTNLAPATCCIGRGLAAIRPLGRVPSRYVLYALRASVENLTAKATGSTFEAISGEQLRSHLLPLPPVAEQQRIVAEIEKHLTRLDAAVGALRRVRANLKRYRASVFKAAVEGRLVPTEAQLARSNGTDYEPAEVLSEMLASDGSTHIEQGIRRDELPPLPEGWSWTSLRRLGEVNRGRSRHRPRNDPKLYDGNYPFIQTGDVTRSKGVIREFSQTYNERGLAQSRLWSAGTLCITIAANIAETGILRFDACFPDSVVGFSSKDDSIVQFVRIFIETTKEELERFAPATAQKNINLQTLERLAVPLAPPRELQRIVDEVERRVSVIDSLESTVEHGVKRAERLRQSVLKRAFEGRLVAQDPMDEPTSILLERIRAEREKLEMLSTDGQRRQRRSQAFQPGLLRIASK